MIDRLRARGRTLAHGARAESDFVDFAEEETEHSIPDRFEKQAGKFPARIAVRGASFEFTYDALNRTANRIAQAILETDTEGEQRVALLLEQDDPLLTAAILGILKAGKIYVPVDPSYPPVRTAYILEDSQASLIVAGTSNLSLARELAGNERHVLNLDEISAGLCDENPGLPLKSDAMAYIIYTSGSTGQPKGVIQTHRNLLSFIRNYTNGLRIRASDHLTLFYSPSFAASLTDIFGALLNGAALHPYNVKQEGFADLATWLIGEGITVFHSVPTLYRHFVDSLVGEEEFPELRIIDLGGEPVSRGIVGQFRKHFPGCILVNHLAATEMNVMAQYFIDSETEISGSTVPVGYAVDGVEVLLIDDAGAEVGSGQVGEITIKSRYVSPGYWRKPHLTQAAFRFDPRSGSERLYRTGDLGRMRPDGCLEHLGRKDSRVKIRGHSVEIAEIEATLLDLGNVKEVAVTALELGQEDTRLVAYIVPRHESFPSVGHLRAALAEALPDYMIPSAFVRLPALPLTPNGKLDRRALPKPDEERPDLECAYEAPCTPAEGALAEIWEEVLGLERVGIHDDFFELGGHSLLAANLFAQIEKAFGQRLPLSTLFQAPTVRQLANILHRESEEVAWKSVVAIQPRGSLPPFFCVPANSPLVFRELAQHLGPEQPLYSFQGEDQNKEQLVSLTIEDTAASYIREMREIQPEGPYFLGGFCFGGVIAFEMARQLRAQGQDVALVAILDKSLKSLPSCLKGSIWGRLYPHRRRLLDYLRQKIWKGKRTVRRVVYKAGTARRAVYKSSLRFRYHLGHAFRNTCLLDQWEKREVNPKAHNTSKRKRRAANPKPHDAWKWKAIWKRNRQTLDSYEAQLYSGRITLFVTAGLKSYWMSHNEPYLGWDRVAAGGVAVHEVPGDHHGDQTLLGEPHVQVLAARLNTCLEQARTSSS